MFSFRTVVEVSVLLLTLVVVDGLFEVDLTGGHSLVPNETKYLSFDMLRVKKASHTEYILDGKVDVFAEIGNKFQVQTLIYKKAGNAYQKTAYHLGPMDFCEYFKNISMIYDDLLLSSDLPAKDVCPWPVKTYTISAFRIPVHVIPKHFEGDFMYEVHITLEDELVNGYQVYMTIISV